MDFKAVSKNFLEEEVQIYMLHVLVTKLRMEI
jgi:hypothetical protein